MSNLNLIVHTKRRLGSYLLLGLMASGLVLGLLTSSKSVIAEPTIEQRKELAGLRTQLTAISRLAAKKNFKEAEKQLTEIEEAAAKLIKDGGFGEKDSLVLSFNKKLAGQKAILQKLQGKAGGAGNGISFSKDIAPILDKNCTGCHGNNGRAKLGLNTFANMKKGGQSGVLLVIGNPMRSLLIQRMIVQGNARMPKGKDALPKEDIEKIAKWIKEGAKFDGSSEKLTMKELVDEAKEKSLPKVVVAKPTGKETVSFKEDIAPFMANICMPCHNTRRKSGGLSMENIETLLRGGDSGEVLEPGKPDSSRLYLMVAAKEQPVMPQGQARITRQNFRDLRKWIEEGIKYDGNDTKVSLRSFVPTANDLASERFSKMTAAEYLKMRKDSSLSQWKKTITSVQPALIESDQFLVYGDVAELRLKQVSKWAESNLADIQQKFKAKSGTAVWKGKLTLFVFKDRFGYQEFNRMIEKREAPRELHSHVKVTDFYENAYIALEDVGDRVPEDEANLEFHVSQQIASAYMLAQSPQLPAWLVEGSGLYFAFTQVPSKDFGEAIQRKAAMGMKSVAKADQIFRPGDLSPEYVGPVGGVVIGYLVSQAGGVQKLKSFIDQINGNQNVNQAFQKVYKTSSANVAQAVAQSLAKVK